MRVCINIDNGTSGSISILSKDLSICEFFQTPKKMEQSYTKKKQNISRIDYNVLYAKLKPYCKDAIAVLERPLVQPSLFRATLSAMRAFEATTIALEQLGIGIQVEDSKKWQKEMLPQGLKGSTELKKASKDIGIRLFPQHKAMITKQKDADALLMGEYWRRNKL